MLITWSDDGYFGLRQSLAGTFREADAQSLKIIRDAPPQKAVIEIGVTNIIIQIT
jgi:hypothetical protein